MAGVFDVYGGADDFNVGDILADQPAGPMVGGKPRSLPKKLTI